MVLQKKNALFSENLAFSYEHLKLSKQNKMDGASRALNFLSWKLLWQFKIQLVLYGVGGKRHCPKQSCNTVLVFWLTMDMSHKLILFKLPLNFVKRRMFKPVSWPNSILDNYIQTTYTDWQLRRNALCCWNCREPKEHGQIKSLHEQRLLS